MIESDTKPSLRIAAVSEDINILAGLARLNPARYFHTLRYLRPIQYFGRMGLWIPRPRPDAASAPPVRNRARRWEQPARRRRSMLSPDQFCFLNVEGEVGTAADWDSDQREKLWLYNLHYFDDLNAEGAAERIEWHQALLDRWVRENLPAQGTGWETYPVSLRIVNWIKWVLAGNELEPAWEHSLAIQARWLRRRIEWHLLGNHLFANAKALVFAGAFFDGPEAKEWFPKGLNILAREVPEQILLDGGHFERSPMYHALILEDLLDLVNLARVYPGVIPESDIREWQAAVQRMRSWLSVMVHPDGDIAFFNDAALGIVPLRTELEAYAGRLDLPASSPSKDGLTHLADSGYIRLQRDEAVALLDVAPIGPDYLLGHAHADTLSFELSLFGRRVIVNSGTSRYGTGAERLRERSTAAHSTVEVNGTSSSEVWSGFRVARRARPFGLKTAEEGHETSVSCAHDGYRRLAGHPVHHRTWRLGKHSLVVEDHVTGQYENAVARFHFHPDAAVEGDASNGHMLLHDGRRVEWRVLGGQSRIARSSWHPEFGLSIDSFSLEVPVLNGTSRVEFSW